VFVLVLIGVHMRKPEWHVVDGLILLSSFVIVWCGLVIAG
jgi:hypothetical protein